MRAAQDISALRQALARIEAARLPGEAKLFSFGEPAVDRALGGGLACGALHEVYAPQPAAMTAAAGFAAALALRAASGRSILWVRQDVVDVEGGVLHAPGLAEFGIDPRRVILVRGRDAGQVLRAGDEAAGCAALGAVLIEPWGEPKLLDLTATRRLALRAAASGVTIFLLRTGTRAVPSASTTRWQVEPVISTPLAAEAPGRPAFAATLLRHRAGLAGRTWYMEWDRETGCFGGIAPLSRAVVSLPAGRAAGPAAAAGDFRRAG